MLAAFVEQQGQSTLNRSCFRAATLASGSEAHTLWEQCLATGDLTAHYGLGVTKFEVSDFDGAYRHLSYYSTLATHDAWTWCWLGRTALAVAKQDEGRAALHRACELEAKTGTETDAAELLSWVQ